MWENIPQRFRMETEIKDPDFVDEYDVDGKGRINLGKDYAGGKVKAAIGVLDDGSEDDKN